MSQFKENLTLLTVVLFNVHGMNRTNSSYHFPSTKKYILLKEQ